MPAPPPRECVHAATLPVAMLSTTSGGTRSETLPVAMLSTTSGGTRQTDVDPESQSPAAGQEDESQALSPNQPKIQRQFSLMGRVHSRIEKLQESSPFHVSERHSEKRVRGMARQAMTMTAPKLGELQQKDTAEPRCKMSFGVALLLTMVLVIGLSCLSIFIPLNIYRDRLNKHFNEQTHDNAAEIRGILLGLVDGQNPLDDLRKELFSLKGLVQDSMWQPLNATLEDSWRFMLEERATSSGWEGKVLDEAEDVKTRFQQLLAQANWSNAERNSSEDIVWLTAEFESGQHITVSVRAPSSEDNAFQSFSVVTDSSSSSLLFEPVDGGQDRVCRGEYADDNNNKYFEVAADGYIQSMSDCQAACVGHVGCKGVEYDNVDRCELWIKPEGIGASKSMDGFECYRYNPGPPGYDLQEAQAFFHPEAVPQQTWSQIWIADGKPSISSSVPIAYCGDYSCFDGAITATSTLLHVSNFFEEKWQNLTVSLKKMSPDFTINADTSSIFALVLKSRFPNQEGMLVGELKAPTELVMARESQRQIVNATAFVLKQRYGLWSVSELQQDRFFSFSWSHATNSTDGPRYESCDSDLAVAEADENCMRVGTVPMSLDPETQWLLVMVLPVVSYRRPPNITEQLAQDAELRVNALREEIINLGDAYRQSFIIFPIVAALSVCMALGLAYVMSYPLRQLDSHMQKLSEFNSTGTSGKAMFQKRSNFIEVGNLQRTFGHLSHGIEAFTRFVPETVVRRIVNGDPRAARLHVTRREVTIMFSDIQDFTAISESLCEEDLLFVLTRYLSVMTRLVEDFSGVVTEVLGDGLLAFWNTPDDLEDHAAKACDAALAQQQAIAFLNEELASFKLPRLQIRIGLHTGRVLSGNLGSETKMKFGCLGDPINLASRLEGLCKFYGVGVVCSSDTRDSLPAGHFFCRRLDKVQVKGRREATEIFQVIGQDKERDHAELTAAIAGGGQKCLRSSTVELALDAISKSAMELSNSSSFPAHKMEKQSIPALPREFSDMSNSVPEDVRSQVQMYETALAAWELGDFPEACRLATELLKLCPEDTAASKLLERSRKFVGADGKIVGISEEELSEWKGVYVMTEK